MALTRGAAHRICNRPSIREALTGAAPVRPHSSACDKFACSPERVNDAAVVVFPGGGYNVLAIDLEGTEACDWLTSKGITCVLLKYRVPCVQPRVSGNECQKGQQNRPHSVPSSHSCFSRSEVRRTSGVSAAASHCDAGPPPAANGCSAARSRC